MSPIWIPVAFLVIAGILAWILIGIKGKWYFKAPLIVGTTWLAIATWVSMADLQGWPVDAVLPRRFEVHALLVREPDKAGTDQGAIYVWATNTCEEARSGWWLLSLSSPRKNEPRCHKTPFSEDGQEQAADAMKLLMAGHRVFGEAKPIPGGQNGRASDKDDDGAGGGDGGKQGRKGSMSPESGFELYELPPGRLLPKGN